MSDKQYWLDFAVYFEENGSAIWTPLSLLGSSSELAAIHEHAFAELLIPYHAPDGKMYGFTCHLVQFPHWMPCIRQAFMLQTMAPEVARVYGALCQEVPV